MGGQRRRAFRQRRIVGVDLGADPAHRRRRVDRRIEIIAERGAERLLEALVDGDVVHHRRPQILALDRQHLRQGLGFGLQPLHAAFGLGQRIARGFERGARGGVGRFGVHCRVLGIGQRLLQILDFRRQRREIGATRAGERLDLAGDLGHLGLDLAGAVAMLAYGGFELVALRREIGKPRREFGEHLFRGRQGITGFIDAGIDAAAAAGALGGLGLDHFFFGREAGDGRFSIGDQLLLALGVGSELHQALVELGDAILGALLLAVKLLHRDIEAMQRGAGAGFGLAQRRQSGGEIGLANGSLGLRLGASGDFTHAQILGVFGGGLLDIRGGPAQVIERRLGLADLRRDSAVADRLLGLLAQRLHLAGELADHVLDAQQVGFGGLQAQFGFMAAGVQAGNAGGFFQHAAALFGLGLNDFADTALVHERRRARAGRSVREYDLHVAGAHFLAVDAIGRTGLALDAAGDLQRIGVVELRRRRTFLVVDQDRDFGVVASRAGVRSREDDVVHRGRAHRLVRVLAHHPAQRFDQVRFAAAVRSDHAGQARLDDKIGRFNKGLETEKTQPGKNHTEEPRPAAAHAPPFGIVDD